MVTFPSPIPLLDPPGSTTSRSLNCSMIALAFKILRFHRRYSVYLLLSVFSGFFQRVTHFSFPWRLFARSISHTSRSSPYPKSTDSILHGILSRCIVLESLVLDANRGCSRLHISSLTLQSLGVSDTYFSVEGMLEEVIIEDAPLLERLTPPVIWHEGFVIRVIQAPKLKTLGYLSQKISTLQLGNMVFQKLVPVSLSNVMRAMKILALHTAPDLDVVIDFLKFFPCVEKLYIVALNKGNFKNVWRYVSLECLDLHLKMVEFINYHGNLSDLNFIKFFVLNAQVLECIKFVACRDKCDAKWIKTQHQRLQLYSRASRGVTLDFQADYGVDSLVYGHIVILILPGRKDCYCYGDNRVLFCILLDPMPPFGQFTGDLSCDIIHYDEILER
uniref:Uncharacterized protein n=1 Tax=Oryza barthii TaxID=65489 RepID=A0A0D3HVM5_9ORYZ